MMRELSTEEVDLICGGGIISKIIDEVTDAFEAIGRMPGPYDRAVTAVTDMMCRATGNC